MTERPVVSAAIAAMLVLASPGTIAPAVAAIPASGAKPEPVEPAPEYLQTVKEAMQQLQEILDRADYFAKAFPQLRATAVSEAHRLHKQLPKRKGMSPAEHEQFLRALTQNSDDMGRLTTCHKLLHTGNHTIQKLFPSVQHIDKITPEDAQLFSDAVKLLHARVTQECPAPPTGAPKNGERRQRRG
jgi:hypothetical protein